MTDDPVQQRCVVTVSSGFRATDQQACTLALASVPTKSAGLPEGTYLFPGLNRRYVNGTCAYPDEFKPTTEQKAACAQLLMSMGKARVTEAIHPELWLLPADLKKLSQKGGTVRVAIGVNASGKASYCVVSQSTASEPSEAIVCQAVLRRARFDPALDKDGQAIPSAYQRGWTY